MDEDNEPDERPPFRWNQQAVFMLFFFMFAMAIPLMGVVWFARGYLSARQHPKPAVVEKQVDTAPLEQGLERMTDEHFSTTVTTVIQDGVEIEVDQADMTGRVARIMELATAAGGSALDLSEAGATERRVTIQVPKSRYELLKRAIRGDLVDFSAIPAGEATQVLQVDLKAP